MKAETVINAAFLLAGVTYQGQTLTNDEMQDGLIMLNDLLAQWEHESFMPDDFSFSDTTTDESIPDAYAVLLKYNLGKFVAGAYSFTYNRDNQEIADQSFQDARSFNFPLIEMSVDKALIGRSGSAYNINRG